MSNTNSLPKYMTALIPKTTSPFCHEWQRASHWEVVISSSPKELTPSSSSASSSLEPLSLRSSFEACGDGDGDTLKTPMIAYRGVIRPARVFTWHNSSLRVSRRASMRSSWAMMALKVTPPTEEGATVDGAKEAGGVAISDYGHFGRIWALLHLMDSLLMAPMMVK